TDSAFVDNAATFYGGAIFGSAIDVTNTTFTGNAAGRDGGAIYQGGGTLRLRNVTVAANRVFEGRGGGLWMADSYAGADMKHTILAGNRDATGEAPDCFAPNPPSNPPSPTQLTSLGYNLVGDSTGCRFLAATGDQVGTAAAPLDVMLADLADNGGPTMTRALLPNSPAVDAGDPAGCTDADGSLLTADQRGAPRPTDGDLDGVARCDIGAFELTGPLGTTTSTTSTTSTTAPGAEVCGNCLDDDQNDLTDFEDPACCAAGGTSGLIVKKARIKPRTGKHVLKLTAALTQGDVGLLGGDVFVQLRQVGGGEVLCARLPAARFTRKKTTARFKDKTHAVESARGVEKAVVRLKRDQSVKLRAAGKQVELISPHEGGARITIGFLGPSATDNRCAGADASLRAARKGALQYP
ncbi:MAG: choice-of-anchor Q domain-containing protein, partial [Gemmatimonadales bacterium]